MTLLILEMLLALAVIIGIMVWTLKTRTDTPIDEGLDVKDGPLPALKTADDKTGVEDAGSSSVGSGGSVSSGAGGGGVGSNDAVSTGAGGSGAGSGSGEGGDGPAA